MEQNPRYNDLRYNDIFGLTMGIALIERKIFPVITMKSISQTTWNTNIVYQNKLLFHFRTITIINVSFKSHELSIFAPVANVNWLILNIFIRLVILSV